MLTIINVHILDIDVTWNNIVLNNIIRDIAANVRYLNGEEAFNVSTRWNKLPIGCDVSVVTFIFIFIKTYSTRMSHQPEAVLHEVLPHTITQFMYRVEFSGSKEIIITSYRNWLIAKSLNVDSVMS